MLRVKFGLTNYKELLPLWYTKLLCMNWLLAISTVPQHLQILATPLCECLQDSWERAEGDAYGDADNIDGSGGGNNDDNRGDHSEGS